MEINPAASQSSSHAASVDTANIAPTTDTANTRSKLASMTEHNAHVEENVHNSYVKVDTTHQANLSGPSHLIMHMNAERSEPITLEGTQDEKQDENESAAEHEHENGDDAGTEKPTLSKNAQKRLLKAQRREQQKLERRAREKATKAAKKAEKAAQRENKQPREGKEGKGEEENDRERKKTELGAKRDREALEERDQGREDGRDDTSEERLTKRRKVGDDDDDIGDTHDMHDAGVDQETNVHENDDQGPKNTTTTRTQRRKGVGPPKETFGAKIVIDLGFDDKMTEREIISLVSQCAYSYSSNRKADKPFSALLFTSLNGRTKARLDTLATYQNWRGVEWWAEDYSELWDTATSTSTADAGSNSIAKPAGGILEGGLLPKPEPELERVFGPEYTCPVTKTARRRTIAPKESIVYLTADSNFELQELSPNETYIIGGIVDKNRYKALCENKARSQSIRTARLPIGSYLKELPTRKVLTVNQVFDILIKWVDCRDWRKALFDVMPQRKFTSEGKSTRRAKAK